MVDKNLKPAVIPAKPWAQYKFGELVSLKCDEREEEYGPPNFKQKGKVLYVTKKFKYSNIQQLVEEQDRCQNLEDADCELLTDEEEVSEGCQMEQDSEEEADSSIGRAEEKETSTEELREHFKRFLI